MQLPSKRHPTTMQRAKRHPRAAGRDDWGKIVAVASFAGLFFMAMPLRCTGILYVNWQIAFDSTAAQTGAVSSIILSTSYFSSLIAGVVCNRYGYRFTCILGGLLTSFPILMSFWASNLAEMYAIAVFTGTGTSFVYLATTVAVADYFRKYYAVMSGISMSGVGMNMVVFAPLLRILLDTYGWRGAMLVTSAVCANLCVVGALYRPYRRTQKRQKFERTSLSLTTDECSNDNPRDSKMCEYACRKCASVRRLFPSLRLKWLVKSYRFSVLCLTGLEIQMAYSCVTVFLIPRATFCGIDELEASFLLSIFGFGSLGGRVASGFFVTRKTPVEVLYTCSFVLCCVGLLCSQAETYASFAASACIFGISIGANKVWSAILLRKLLGVPLVASGQGLHLTVCGLGDLVAPIVAGGIYDITGNFSTVFYVLTGLLSATVLQMMLFPLFRKIEPGIPERDESQNA